MQNNIASQDEQSWKKTSKRKRRQCLMNQNQQSSPSAISPTSSSSCSTLLLSLLLCLSLSPSCIHAADERLSVSLSRGGRIRFDDFSVFPISKSLFCEYTDVGVYTAEVVRAAAEDCLRLHVPQICGYNDLRYIGLGGTTCQEFGEASIEHYYQVSSISIKGGVFDFTGSSTTGTQVDVERCVYQTLESDECLTYFEETIKGVVGDEFQLNALTLEFDNKDLNLEQPFEPETEDDLVNGEQTNTAGDEGSESEESSVLAPGASATVKGVDGSKTNSTGIIAGAAAAGGLLVVLIAGFFVVRHRKETEIKSKEISCSVTQSLGVSKDEEDNNTNHDDVTGPHELLSKMEMQKNQTETLPFNTASKPEHPIPLAAHRSNSSSSSKNHVFSDGDGTLAGLSFVSSQYDDSSSIAKEDGGTIPPMGIDTFAKTDEAKLKLPDKHSSGFVKTYTGISDRIASHISAVTSSWGSTLFASPDSKATKTTAVSPDSSCDNLLETGLQRPSSSFAFDTPPRLPSKPTMSSSPAFVSPARSALSDVEVLSDFEQDNAWDPDDNSVSTNDEVSNDGANVFYTSRPLLRTSTARSDDHGVSDGSDSDLDEQNPLDDEISSNASGSLHSANPKAPLMHSFKGKRPQKLQMEALPVPPELKDRPSGRLRKSTTPRFTITPKGYF